MGTGHPAVPPMGAHTVQGLIDSSWLLLPVCKGTRAGRAGALCTLKSKKGQTGRVFARACWRMLRSARHWRPPACRVFAPSPARRRRLQQRERAGRGNRAWLRSRARSAARNLTAYRSFGAPPPWVDGVEWKLGGLRLPPTALRPAAGRARAAGPREQRGCQQEGRAGGHGRWPEAGNVGVGPVCLGVGGKLLPELGPGSEVQFLRGTEAGGMHTRRGRHRVQNLSFLPLLGSGAPHARPHSTRRTVLVEAALVFQRARF
ncbi:MAG: hypothetical protein J3K34DRAFT_425557 [Monoraphidium minutum]|nr:MAG: hypothetical protein J3K34DRAFT_425557 [Monoraphidium minutum]